MRDMDECPDVFCFDTIVEGTEGRVLLSVATRIVRALDDVTASQIIEIIDHAHLRGLRVSLAAFM